MKDLQGTDRGECTKCGECKEYQRAKEGNDCDYCGCKPVQHTKKEGGTTPVAAPTKAVGLPPPNKVSAPPPQKETVFAPPKPTPEMSVKATRPPESNIPPKPVKEAPTPETLPPKPNKAAPESFPPKPNKPAPSVVSDVIPPKPHKTAPVPGMENAPPKPVKAPPKPGDDDLYPVGIRSAHGMFFTVETFGDQLSANGATLRTKQLFMIQTDGQGRFAFKGHKGKYLSADHKEVTAGAPSKGQNEWFTLEYYNGVAAIRNSSGKYFSVDPSHNISLASSASTNELFEIIIDCHPQVCLVNGKKFVAVEGNNVVSSRDTQFGWDTSLTMEDGPYRGSFAFRSVTGKYFNVDHSGSVVATSTDKSDQLSLFTFEFFGTNLAIKSIGTGNYLGVQGPGIKALKPTVTTKEVWKIVHSDPQVTVKASNGKYVSYQGTNLISNKDKTSNTEVFILESHGDKFSLKTVTEEYWSVDSDTITVQTKNVGPTELFNFQYIQGKIAFLGPNGKYVTSKPLGGIDAKAPSVTAESIFEVYLLNRPYVVLKTNQSSYVGATDDKVRTNKATPEGFSLQFRDGAYAIQTPQGWYLNESGDQGRICAGSEPEWFFLEFSQYSRLAIKTQRGKYLKSENQGFLVATSNTITPNELFEF